MHTLYIYRFQYSSSSYLDKMAPIRKSRYLREQNSDSSQHEESLPAAWTLSDDSNLSVYSTLSVGSTSSIDSTLSVDSTSSVDSTLSVDSTSSVDSTLSVDPTSVDDLAVPSTSRECEVSVVDLTSSASSVRVCDLTSPLPSTSSMRPTSPIQMPPEHAILLVPSTSRGIQENYNDFRFEAARRASFPVPFINPASFAAAGLYYTGEMDIVRCFDCQLELCHWSEGDISMLIYEMYSSDCKFVRNEHCNNVPIGADPVKYLETTRRNRNISWPYSLQRHQESFDFNNHRSLRYARNPAAYELSRLGLQKVTKPGNLDYTSYESRLNSFATWPTYMTKTSEELADAGFYFTGIDDITACYYCGVHIGYWGIEEDAWELHANLSPSCSYLLTVRGTEYVNNVTRQELHETSTEAAIQTTVGIHEGSHSENKTNETTPVEKIAALEQECKKLIDARSCKVCTEREATTTFLPCRHLATCRYCSSNFN